MEQAEPSKEEAGKPAFFYGSFEKGRTHGAALGWAHTSFFDCLTPKRKFLKL